MVIDMGTLVIPIAMCKYPLWSRFSIHRKYSYVGQKKKRS